MPDFDVRIGDVVTHTYRGQVTKYVITGFKELDLFTRVIATMTECDGTVYRGVYLERLDRFKNMFDDPAWTFHPLPRILNKTHIGHILVKHAKKLRSEGW